MFTLSDIRAKARETMQETKGIYLLSIIPVVISLIFQLLSSSNSDATYFYALDSFYSSGYLLQMSFFSIFYGLLIGLITLSISWTLYKVIRKRQSETSFKDAIALFNHPEFGKIIGTYLLKYLFLILWGIIFYIGLTLLIVSLVFILIIALVANLQNIDSIPQEYLITFGLFFTAGIVLSLIGAAIYIPQAYAYSQVELILFGRLDRQEYTSASAIIKESRQLMKGYKWKKFLLDLTFLGWFILSGITFGLAGIYTIPYYAAAQIHFHDAILAERKETEQRTL